MGLHGTDLHDEVALRRAERKRTDFCGQTPAQWLGLNQSPLDLLCSPCACLQPCVWAEQASSELSLPVLSLSPAQSTRVEEATSRCDRLVVQCACLPALEDHKEMTTTAAFMAFLHRIAYSLSEEYY